jgi:DNA polymerase-3 subunit gamma/tau
MSLFPEAEPYRVLARKYRPAGFEALIGQDAMVQTLANAIATNRLAQAWLLTGVRGVGKTSTARIIAKCLNCIGPDGQGGPTVTPCGVCSNCMAIAAGSHIDVTEIDAASNNGVDDVREMIEAVRYSPAQARYRVFIIDEVHMMSKSAFNALLKTLEEPPAHVKFMLATTEIDKVPATILSRCQRFDLKRVPRELLEAHFAKVAAAEGVEAEPAALALIARAAEGSVRDGLSILDQAIAMGNGAVSAGLVRDMLGLAERGRTVRLFRSLAEGDAALALAEVDASWTAGVEPVAIFRDLLDLVHGLTRQAAGGSLDPDLPEADRADLQGLSLGFPALHRLWQLLLKGHGEILSAPQPRDAADMAILRIAHAAGLPTPEDLMALMSDGTPLPAGKRAAPAAGASRPGPAPTFAPTPAPAPDSMAALARLFEARGEPLLARLLNDCVAPIAFAPGSVRLARTGAVPADFAGQVSSLLSDWTGSRWTVSLEEGTGTTLREETAARHAADRARAEADPLVASLLAAFPSAELLTVDREEQAA